MPQGVFQKVTQAENSYPAKRIEVSSMEASVWESKHTVTMTLSTLIHWCAKKALHIMTAV